ncbi:MAG: sigma-70 family RNA polymerase sigma factor [Gammaproteobacteria bacterium]|nr:sigma-70 family RNA polymerase sigma factor [Gammaproteobacteria bacterium]MDP2140634.1 sigma-70 family RNA polymerase sigma factor [Gammaproteobacteria bacterium]MDP2347406.1 sigma-70 family RNA polymerase sigma factor [Gammaproteobacteria bacterium]
MSLADQDEVLIGAALEGSARAWERLVKRYEGRVYNFSLRLTGNQTDALDLMQEVFLGVYRNLHRFRGDSLFTTWLFRIAHNKAVDMNRCRRLFMQQDQPGGNADGDDADPYDRVVSNDPRQDPAVVLIEEQGNSVISRHLESLSWDQRLIVELKVFQSHTFEEIAELQDIPANTAKTRFYTALRKLKSILEQDHVM